MDATQPAPAVDAMQGGASPVAAEVSMVVGDPDRRTATLRLKRFELLHAQLPSTIVGSLTTGLLVIVLLHSLDASQSPFAWFACLLAISL